METLEIPIEDSVALVIGEEHHHGRNRKSWVLLFHLLLIVAAFDLYQLSPARGLVSSFHRHALALYGHRELVRPLGSLGISGTVFAAQIGPGQLHLLSVGVASAHRDCFTEQPRVPAEMIPDLFGDAFASGLSEQNVIVVCRSLPKGARVKTFRKETHDSQVVVVQVGLSVLHGLQHMVSLQVFVDPLHDMLPLSPLNVVFKDGAIHKQLHRGICTDLI
mmetsp:Transcript_70839/g.156283  ORF Transcript_70839/g.156283 Transcript_70839/m.156283 type:complete len:219 (-) Transcript_70839:321-977(-)